MEELSCHGTTLYRHVYKYIDSNMYILLAGPHALIIDPHQSEDLLPFLKARNVTDVTILLTHEHYDHICGVPALQAAFPTSLICTQACAEMLAIAKHNRPLLISYILAERDRQNGTTLETEFKGNLKPFTINADTTFTETHSHHWHGHTLSFQRTPGHTPGSCCILLDEKILFTGDTLQKSLATITRFPGGSMKDFQNISLPFLQSLDTTIYALPGHEDGFSLGEKFGTTV